MIETAERGIQKGKNEEAERWLIQYRIYVKFGGILGPGSERCVVSHMLPEWPSFSHPKVTLCSVTTGHQNPVTNVLTWCRSHMHSLCLGKLTRVPLSRPSTFGGKRGHFLSVSFKVQEFWDNG